MALGTDSGWEDAGAIRAIEGSCKVQARTALVVFGGAERCAYSRRICDRRHMPNTSGRGVSVEGVSADGACVKEAHGERTLRLFWGELRVSC